VVISLGYAYKTIERNKDWADNKTLFASALEHSQDGVITLSNTSAIAIEEEKWEDAQEVLERIFSIYDKHSYSWNLYGIIAHKNGEIEVAKERYLKSIELGTKPINAYINLSNLYYSQGMVQEAADALLKVIEFNPTAKHTASYAYLNIELETPQKGIDAIIENFGTNPSSVDLNEALGTVYFSAKEYDKAEVYLKTAIELGSKADQVVQLLELIKESRNE